MIVSVTAKVHPLRQRYPQPCPLPLLLGLRILYLLQVEQLSAEFEGERQLLLKDLAVLLDFIGVAVLQFREGLGVLLLSLEEVLVPLLVELLVLLDVRLLALLPLLRLVEDELLKAAVVVLLLKFGDAVFGHFGLNVLAFPLAGVPMVLQDLAVEALEKVSQFDDNRRSYLHEVLDIVSVRLLVQSLFFVGFHCSN